MSSATSFYITLTFVAVVMLSVLYFGKDINDDSSDDEPKRAKPKRSKSR